MYCRIEIAPRRKSWEEGADEEADEGEEDVELSEEQKGDNM